jgi:hypothetical protein
MAYRRLRALRRLIAKQLRRRTTIQKKLKLHRTLLLTTLAPSAYNSSTHKLVKARHRRPTIYSSPLIVHALKKSMRLVRTTINPRTTLLANQLRSRTAAQQVLRPFNRSTKKCPHNRTRPMSLTKTFLSNTPLKAASPAVANSRLLQL